jgi:TP901 family phage tail tape measure protein
MSRFSISAIIKGEDRFSAPIARMEKSLDRFSRKAKAGLGAMSKPVDATLGALKQVGVAAGAAGLGLGAALFEAGKSGADFEEAITAVGAVSLMSRDQIADLEKKALELGASTKFSATEAANAMELMGRAGFTNKEILESVGGVLSAAAAEGMGLADAAGVISNTLKGMGLEASETTRVADVLALASARTNSSIMSLGESMSNVSATARQLKIPLEDTVAAVALLQDVGLDASESGTAVSTMLTKLAVPSKEAKEQMQALGISFQNSHGDMLPLGKVIAQFGKASEKAGGNMKTLAFFSELTGLRGQKAAISLAEMGRKGKLADLTEELMKAKGSAEKMAALRMNNLKGDFEQLSGAVDTLKIALFNTQSGPLRGIVQGMTDWVGKNQELITSKFAEYVQKVVDNKDDIIAWGKGIAYAGGTLIALKVALVAGEIAIGAFGVATTVASGVSTVFAGAMSLAAAAAETETAATIASTAAQGARTAGLYLMNAAINIGTFATTGFTTSTITSTVAGWASAAVTGARSLAMGGLNVATELATTLIYAYRNGTLLATAAQMAQTGILWLKNAAIAAGNAVMAVAAVAHGEFATSAIGAAAANGSLVASFAPFLVTVAAATAAVGALYAAWTQWKALNAETEGLGITGTVGQMIEQGTFDPFKAVDTFQNNQARSRAAQPQLQSGANSTQRSESVERVDLRVHGPATVNRAPAPSSNLQITPSGGM